MAMNSLSFTSDSRIREIVRNPVGHDIVEKILNAAGKSLRWADNPVIGRLRLRQLRRLAPKLLDDGLMRTLLGLLNGETEISGEDTDEIRHAWWKEAVVYQIYPRSFMDSDGDGIGDLPGILSKLDYLKYLGVNVIWLSPVYDSPNDDNGYDIRDYRAIMKEFGTMADFDRLLTQAHARGIRLIMDLVVNHTSDEHPWFQSALHDTDSPYRDYYIWKKAGRPGQAPNNWASIFGGGAWNFYPERSEWALHLFTKKQMDLNWENRAMRADLYDMINWWLRKGIDGFRLDAISYISKEPGLPDGNEALAKAIGYCGAEHYFYGPRLHEYLREMREKTFGRYDVFTVGETAGVGMEMSRLLTAHSRGELDTLFCFDHLENPGKTKFDDYRYDLNHLKKVWSDWQLHFGGDCWNTLFLENHDNPRMISKVNPDLRYREALGKLLGLIELTLGGTPFIYQGQELGMVNSDFRSPAQLRDVESLNLYRKLRASMSEADAMKRVNAGSRDHARTPMRWDAGTNAGFSAGTPWIEINGRCPECNAADEMRDADSVLNFYRELIALRHAHPVLMYGRFVPVEPKTRDIFAYCRELDGERFYIEANLTEGEKAGPRPVDGLERLLGNYPARAERLQPYEAAVYRIPDEKGKVE